MTTRRAIVLSSVATAVAIAALGVWTVSLPRWRVAAADIPTAPVARGHVKLDVYVRGELSAARSVALTAPPAGGMLRLTKLAEIGEAVRAGDVVMEFDPAEQQHAFEQSRSQLLEAEQEIVKTQADAEVEAAAAAVELLTARFDVRRAELDASAGQELLGAIEARKRMLTLEEARRKLAELEAGAASRAATNRAAVTALEEKRNKAKLLAERAQVIIDSLIIRAPIDGHIAVRENLDMTTFFFSGMTLPSYRAGDTVMPGRIVLEVLDASRMEIKARVDEQDRPGIAVGQPATISTDALAGMALPAKVSGFSVLASRGTGFGPPSGPVRQFDVMLQLEGTHPQLRAGTTVSAVITGKELRDVLHVPRQALFEHESRPVVYVRTNTGFEPQRVTVVQANQNRVVVEGVAEQSEVALVNPRTRQ